MTPTLDRYFQDLPGFKERWENNFALPYVNAYNKAYNSYQDTLKKQAESDEAKAELLVLSASILSGSVMMAVFATTSLRTVVSSRLLNFICNNNLERTFNAYHMVATSRPAMFALGALADKANETITKAVKDAVSATVAHHAPVQRQDVMGFDIAMRRFLGVNSQCARDVATAIRDNGALSNTRKDQLIDELRASPFHHPPQQNVINEQTLSDRMELSFYLTDILDSDYVQETTTTPTPYGAGATSKGKRTPIDMMPSNQNYPVSTSQTYPPLHNITFAKEVRADTPGSKVRDRVDQLHRSVIGGSFYRDGNFFEDMMYETNRADLRKAEAGLYKIGNIMRPPTLRAIAV